MVISNTLFCLRFFYFIYKLILTTHTQHEYIFSLICNVNIQNAQAAAFKWHDWWMGVLERQSNFLWQTPTSCQMLYHLKFELSRPDAFYLMFLILTVVKKIYRVFICGVDIQNGTCALATAFCFWLMMKGCSWKMVIFFWQKMSHSRGFNPEP